MIAVANKKISTVSSHLEEQQRSGMKSDKKEELLWKIYYEKPKKVINQI